ncbi:MAG TPA: ankyrin repeat domain-containing protein, partial [Candidatus Acidoferrum sp.]|nr:ankyrin repeat domain-containing protein [Candidatus Acidoferrum sp.]
MKMFNLLFAVLLLAFTVRAAEPLTELLQRGLFEEEANRNLDAAIKAYDAVIKHSDEQRKVIATAVFRLGECYRKLGRTNEAHAQYQRILRDFTDQEALAAISQSLLPRAAAQTAAVKVVMDPAAVELLRQEVALAEKQVQFAEKKAQANLAPLTEVLDAKRDVLRLKRLLPENSAPAQQREVLQQQIELVKKTLREWERKIEVGVLPPGDEIPIKRELVGLQRELATVSSSQPTTVVNAGEAPGTDEEEKEVRRIQSMIKDSPDLINAALGVTEDTPLHLAASRGQLVVARFLLENKANVNARNKLSETPLHVAA